MGTNDVRSNAIAAITARGSDTRIVLGVVEVGQALGNDVVVS